MNQIQLVRKMGPLGELMEKFPLFGELPEGFRLEIGRMHKGQLFLNGHNLGRFWQVGGNSAQSRYYLPRPWMRAQNTLAVFEEYGLPPQGVALCWGEPRNYVTTEAR